MIPIRRCAICHITGHNTANCVRNPNNQRIQRGYQQRMRGGYQGGYRGNQMIQPQRQSFIPNRQQNQNNGGYQMIQGVRCYNCNGIGHTAKNCRVNQGQYQGRGIQGGYRGGMNQGRYTNNQLNSNTMVSGMRQYVLL